MIECQGPSGRYRMGEVVHDDVKEREEGAEPEMEVGGAVEMDVGSEMKDVGVNLLICSVAWETDSGRRTFQRFFKFEVSYLLSYEKAQARFCAEGRSGNTASIDQDSGTCFYFADCAARPTPSIRCSPRDPRSEHLKRRIGIRQGRSRACQRSPVTSDPRTAVPGYTRPRRRDDVDVVPKRYEAVSIHFIP